MARANQGVYKKYKNETKAILNETNKLKETHFNNEISFTGDYESAFDFFSEANELYERASEQITKYNNLVETQKFEGDSTTDAYIENIKNLSDVKSDLRNRAYDLKGVLEQDFSENEKSIFNSYEIFKPLP